MQYIADAREAKKIDGVSIHEIGIPSFVLMERAALKVADFITGIADMGKDRILILCGMGNNGGDGLAIGRILMERGFQIAFTLLGEEKKASEEMKQQIFIARNLSVPEVTNPQITDYTMIVDAIFGIGLARGITGNYAACIEEVNHADATVISVDIPSGIDASTGKVLGCAIQADYTITFGINKRGLVLFPGAMYAGQVLIEEIGFPKKAVGEVAPAVFSYEKSDIPKLFPKRIPRSNKGSYGKCLVIAGSGQISGAAYFAAAAAYRMGSGLVKVLTHENNRIMLQAKLPEALLTTYSEEENSPSHNINHNQSGTACKENSQHESKKEKNTEFIRNLQKELSWASAVIIGPGLGTSPMAELFLQEVLKIRDIPVLIDADGLNLLSKLSEYFGENNMIRLPANFVLTPHLKEMSRLIDKEVSEIQENLMDAACQHTVGATVVLKDARTVVSDGTKIYLNQSGNSALAKGGSGDVLSGMIGGLLVRGMKPFDAAALGVYLHGLTAEEYVKRGGFSTMFASDILEELLCILP